MDLWLWSTRNQESRFVQFECSSVVMTIDYRTKPLLLLVIHASDLGEPRGRRGPQSDFAVVVVATAIAILLYLPALPNRIDFSSGNKTVRLNQRPLRAHVKIGQHFRKAYYHTSKTKRSHRRPFGFPRQCVSSGSVWSAEASCDWRELGLWHARSTATSRQLGLPTGRLR